MKDKAYILDLNLLSEQNLSIHEFMTLMYLNGVGEYTEIYEKYYKCLEEKQFIKIDNEKRVHIREKGKLLIEFIEIESLGSVKENKVIKKSARALNVGLDDFINEFRNKWKGLKSGSMGAPNTVKDKLYRWMQENPSYSKEQILKAADIYLNSVENHQYLQQADYFIYKKEGKDEHSRLSAFVDEVETKSEGWTSQLK